MSVKDITSLIYSEGTSINKAIQGCLPQINKAISHVISSLKKGGVLWYVGAGTSGRLGVLDASEIWPTFGSKQIRGIIAGGKKALLRAVEGAEDNAKKARAIIRKHVKKEDIVLGIAASGNTIFTLEALKEARKKGCKTLGLVCAKNSKIKDVVNACIEVDVGEEIIQGSTRMKAGTATKIILNMISTASMIQLGKVYRNMMIDVQPTNAKLRKRAMMILSNIIKNANEDMLQKAGWNIRVAVVMAKKHVDKKTAMNILKQKNMNLRKIIQD